MPVQENIMSSTNTQGYDEPMFAARHAADIMCMRLLLQQLQAAEEANAELQKTNAELQNTVDEQQEHILTLTSGLKATEVRNQVLEELREKDANAGVKRIAHIASEFTAKTAHLTRQLASTQAAFLQLQAKLESATPTIRALQSELDSTKKAFKAMYDILQQDTDMYNELQNTKLKLQEMEAKNLQQIITHARERSTNFAAWEVERQAHTAALNEAKTDAAQAMEQAAETRAVIDTILEVTTRPVPLCTICADGQTLATHVAGVCGHLCMCETCAAEIKIHECPICRSVPAPYRPFKVFYSDTA